MEPQNIPDPNANTVTDAQNAPSAGQEAKKDISKKDIVIIILLLLLIMMCVVAGYLYWDKNARSSSPEPDSGSESQREEETSEDVDLTESDEAGEETEETLPDEEEVTTDESMGTEDSCTFTLTEASSPGSGEIFTRWTVDGCDTSNGYRVLRANSGVPVYPESDYRDIEDSAAEFGVWTENVSGTYQVRMCLIADDGSCGTYTTNTMTVTVL